LTNFRLALKFYRYEEIAVNKLRRQHPDFVSSYFLLVYNDEMKLIILKIGKLVTGHPSLVTIGLGLAITFAIGTAIEMLDVRAAVHSGGSQTRLSFEHIFSNDIF
jgi:hypothetical protein